MNEQQAADETMDTPRTKCCAGPGGCAKCRQEEEERLERIRQEAADEFRKRQPFNTSASPDVELERFPDTARRIVHDYLYTKSIDAGAYPHTYGPNDIYVVWFCYILGGWKAMVSTSIQDGKYFEVTHNVDRGETYLDVYLKADNVIAERIPTP